MMVLVFSAASLALVALWPDSLPPAPREVQAGAGLTHVEATALNLRYKDDHRRATIEHHVRLGAVGVVICGVLWVGYRLARRME
jgi:hypothetical protein